MGTRAIFYAYLAFIAVGLALSIYVGVIQW